MTAPKTFRASVLTRAVNAAQRSGFKVAQIEIRPDGTVVLAHEVGTATPKQEGNSCDAVFGLKASS